VTFRFSAPLFFTLDDADQLKGFQGFQETEDWVVVAGDPLTDFLKAREALFLGYLYHNRKPSLLNVFKQVDFVGMKVIREKQLVTNPVKRS
jgi:hypothetical protein